MGTIDMDDGTFYKTNPDDSRELIEPICKEFGFDGKRVFLYDQESELLKINRFMFPENTLESLAREAESPNGGELRLDSLGQIIYVRGFKKVEYLTAEESLMETQQSSYQHIQKRGLIDKIKDYISGKDPLG